VRVHHPDAPGAPPQAQARFLAIKAAYDVLRGVRPGVAGDVPGESAAARAKRDLDAAIWRAKQARRADTFTSGGDDRWQDRLLITLVVVVSHLRLRGLNSG
jgi:DnaJ-class molecular chaperone